MLKYAFFHNPPKSHVFSLFIAFLLTIFFGQKNYLCKKIFGHQKIVGLKYIFVAEGGFFFFPEKAQNHLKMSIFPQFSKYAKNLLIFQNMLFEKNYRLLGLKIC